jgi:hypothetical protein
MAAPNLRAPVSIIGKTVLYSATASLAEVLSNATDSGKLLKVNTIRAANTTLNSPITLDVTIYRGAAHKYLIRGVIVPGGRALIISDKNEYIYLEEGDSLYVMANFATSMDLTINYEEIS